LVQIDFYINGNLVQQPINWQELQIELSFENDSPDAVINTAKLVWVGQEASIINAWFQGGMLSAGNTGGIFSGLPLQIKICPTQEVIFDGIIDLTDPETFWSCDKVQVKIVNYQIDLFNGLVDSVSYAYLATSFANGGPSSGPYGGAWISPTLLSSPNSFQNIATLNAQCGNQCYIPILYQRNDIPDDASIMQAALMAYNIYNQIKSIVSYAANIITTAAAGASDILGALEAAAAILLEVAMIAINVALILAEFNAILYQLVQPVRHKLGMYVQTLLEQACAYFGFGFSSTILGTSLPANGRTAPAGSIQPLTPFNNLVIMPRKGAWPINTTALSALWPGSAQTQDVQEYDDVANFQNGGYAYGYPDMTPGDLIRALEDVFCARAKIIIDPLSGLPVMHFERWDYQYQLASYTMPNINSQAPFLANEPLSKYNPFGTNAADVPANYEVAWQTDTSDANTLNDYRGTTAYCTTTVNGSLGGNISMLRNLVQKNLAFAQAKPKLDHTSIENFALDIIQIVTGGPGSTLSQILTLLGNFTGVNLLDPWPFGVMQLSSDVTGVPKLFMATIPTVGLTPSVSVYDNNKGSQTAQGASITACMSATSLMKYFHFSQLPAYQAPDQNHAFLAPFTPNQLATNQWLVFQNQTIPMCCAEYNLVKNNNYIYTFDNQIARVDSLKWNPYKGTATIDYRIRTAYCNNLVPAFYTDGLLAGTNITNQTYQQSNN